MNFREVAGIKDLINSEGPILKIVESIDHDEVENEGLYLRGNCLEGKCHIYTKVNDAVLELYFQGRISLKELFLLRKDESYIMERNGKQELVFCDEEFENGVIDTIECGNYHYYSLSIGMRLENPFEDVLHVVKKDYMNGIGATSTEKITGRKWIGRNL